MKEAVSDLEYIRSLTSNSKILEFGAFLIEERENRQFPSFVLENLLRIPHLAPNIFAYDFRDGLDMGLLVAHAGTRIDREYGYNVTGTTLERHYPGDDNKRDVLDSYYRVYEDNKKFYSHRTIHIQKNEWSPHSVAESLMFPCSTNQSDIDFGLGIVLYDPVDTAVENVYVHW